MSTELSFKLQRPSEIAAEAIWIFHKLSFGFAGINGDRVMTAIFPLEGKLPVVGRGSGSLRIDYRSGVQIHMLDVDTVSNCCIVTCPDLTLERSFSALVNSLSEDLAAKPSVTARDFGQALAGWERLFQKRRRLSSDEEQGLWGELYFLSTCKSLEVATASWRGPSAEDYDFLVDGTAFEVKASSRQGRHHVSHAQVSQAVRPSSVYLISLWVGEDPVEGRTLPQMVELIGNSTQDPVCFEEKLLNTGYSRADDDLYDRSFTSLEPSALFDMFTVPRVRTIDPGVMSLSYEIQLNWQQQLTDIERDEIFARAFSLDTRA